MATYAFGGTPDSYVEDRETGQRMTGIQLTVLDAVTDAPVVGLATSTGLPTATVATDADGYFAFQCESAAVVIVVTDSQGTARWGPIAAANAIRDAVTAIPGVVADTGAVTAGLAAHTSALDPHTAYLTNTRGDARYPLTTDPRLTNARTPTAHKTSHATGGGDAITPADIGAATAAHNHDGTYWRMWSGTQAAYDAIATKDPNTLYAITSG